ncbi:hypothetical protein B0H14DRAFT_2575495 [Mycena olivaceomarginata]|nr:hypothetical protein B0H14DRAFT_2575495 [Mycena olivaceomarginata]
MLRMSASSRRRRSAAVMMQRTMSPLGPQDRVHSVSRCVRVPSADPTRALRRPHLNISIIEIWIIFLSTNGSLAEPVMAKENIGELKVTARRTLFVFSPEQLLSGTVVNREAKHYVEAKHRLLPGSQASNGPQFFKGIAQKGSVEPVADNLVFAIFWPILLDIIRQRHGVSGTQFLLHTRELGVFKVVEHEYKHPRGWIATNGGPQVAPTHLYRSMKRSPTTLCNLGPGIANSLERFASRLTTVYLKSGALSPISISSFRVLIYGELHTSDNEARCVGPFRHRAYIDLKDYCPAKRPPQGTQNRLRQRREKYQTHEETRKDERRAFLYLVRPIRKGEENNGRAGAAVSWYLGINEDLLAKT